MPASATPIALKRAIDAEKLCNENPCEYVRVLGSFWPNTRNSFESHIVKAFKESHPVQNFQPHILELCEFYAELICKPLTGEHIDWVVRVLSSSEKTPEKDRPQSLLVDLLCKRLHARDATHVFYKSESRPSMRSVGRLSGPNALKSRIQYAVQDLFIHPGNLQGNALLLDDIYNTGASMRVYGCALKEYAGITRIFGVNLAATRFGGGKDGHGMLKLDLSCLSETGGLSRVWADKDELFHNCESCSSIRGPISVELRFRAERTCTPCPACYSVSKPKRKWWQWPR